MKYALVVLILLSMGAICANAKTNYDLTITVLSTQNITAERGSFHLRWGGGAGGAAWTHRVTEHVFAQCSNGTTMELAPENEKNMLTPGEYPARITRNEIIVGFPVKKGYKEIKMKVFEAHATSEVTEPVPVPAVQATQSPAAQAKQAQQYADCLKAAVDNPSIVCK